MTIAGRIDDGGTGTAQILNRGIWDALVPDARRRVRALVEQEFARRTGV